VDKGANGGAAIVDGCVVMTTESKTRLVFGTCYNVHSFFFQLTCDTFLTDFLVRYAKCIFRLLLYNAVIRVESYMEG
jgi:hypothetical protein